MKIKKTVFILMLIVLAAFIARALVSQYIDVSTDEMIYSLLPLNIISTGRLGTVEQHPLAFYFNDLSYMIFGGISPISQRFPSILFGSLAVIIVFLIAQKMFDRRAGFFAAALFAFSGYALEHNVEMDMVAYFFALFSMYYFISSLGNKNKTQMIFAEILFACAILVKNIVMLFIPAFVLVYFFHIYKNGLKRRDVKQIGTALAIGIIMLTPIIAYNYITLKEKGITDVYVSNILGIGESPHGGGISSTDGWSLNAFISHLKSVPKKIAKFDWLILIGGVFGILAAWKKKTTWMLVTSISVLFAYTAGITASSSHYLWIPLVMSIFAGGFVSIADKYLRKKSFKYTSIIIAIIIASTLFSVSAVAKDSYQKSLTIQLREQTRTIPDDAIVVLDPRIYTGIHAWTFHDKHYVNGIQYAQMQEAIAQSTSPRTTRPLYYIECGITKKTCGWKPEDYARVSDFGVQLTQFFKNQTTKVGEVRTQDHVIIHQGSIDFPDELIKTIDRTHTFWFYPIGYKYNDLSVDYLEPKGISKIANALGLLILYIDVLLALAAIPLVFILLKNNGKENEKQHGTRPEDNTQ
jgi:hypothetical protein